AGAYAKALREFEAARSDLPLPAFDFNIGRCHEQLDELQAAAEAYERYIESTPTPADAPEVRDRITLLRDRLAQASAIEALPSPAPARRRVPWLAIGVGAGAAAALAIGGGFVGSVAADFDRLRSSCGSACL